MLNRQKVYCAGNNMGKSHLCITVSPPDHECPKIFFYALPEGEREPVESQVLHVSLRFKVLADKPGAAALHFERIARPYSSHCGLGCQVKATTTRWGLVRCT